MKSMNKKDCDNCDFLYKDDYCRAYDLPIKYVEMCMVKIKRVKRNG